MRDSWWELEWELPFERIKYFSYYALKDLEYSHIYEQVFQDKFGVWTSSVHGRSKVF